ncbi:MAG: hypothetical protein AAGI07_02445 [Bacteroidota bacterium]
MAAYLLNISVDTVDLNPKHIPEDLSINDQESFVELFVEKILGFEHAIAEYQDNDTEEHNNKKNSQIKIVFLYSHLLDNPHFFLQKEKQEYPLYNALLTQGYNQINLPPPKTRFVLKCS